MLCLCILSGTGVRAVGWKSGRAVSTPRPKQQQQTASRRTGCSATTLQRSLTALEELWAWGADNGVKGLNNVEPKDTGMVAVFGYCCMSEITWRLVGWWIGESRSRLLWQVEKFQWYG